MRRPIGEVVVASPTFYRLHAAFRGAAAHAGIRPEAGRSAILAAAKAIAVMPHGRIDDETTTNVGTIAGGAGGTNVVAEHCWFDAEARSLSDAAVETLVAEMVDHCNDAANDPACECDVDVTVERVFSAYRQRTTAPGVVAAEAALRACNYTPRRILSGGGSDANAFEANGFHCINLANGTEHNHESARARQPGRPGGHARRDLRPARRDRGGLGARKQALAQGAAQELAGQPVRGSSSTTTISRGRL